MKNLLIILLIIMSKNIKALDEVSSDEILRQYNEILKVLKSGFTQRAKCFPLKGRDQSLNKCTFKNFCEVLESNAESSHLYEGNDGRIPNYNLLNSQIDVDICNLKVQQAANHSKPGVGNSFNMEKWIKEKIEARRNLLSVVGKEKKAIDYLKFQEVALTLELENSSKNMGYNMNIKLNREGLEQEFNNIQAKAGVNLGEKIKEAFILAGLAENTSSAETNSLYTIPPSLSDNPFLDSNLSQNIKSAGTKEKALAHQEVLRRSSQRANRIFEDSQKQILRFLKSKKTNDPAKDKAIEQMVIRIKTISYDPNINFSNRSCQGPNAFYSPYEHRFTLCPQIMEFPEATLKAIIVHELGHSIDPCLVSQPLYALKDIKKAKNDYLDRIMNPTETDDFIPLKKENIEHTHSVDYMSTALNQLNVHYESYRRESISIGIPISENPFAQSISCLSDSESLGARGSSKDEVREELEHSLERLKAQGATESDIKYANLKKSLTDLDGLYDNIGACSVLPGNSQLQEGFSDWLAAEIIGTESKEINEEEQRRHAFESFGFFLAMDCNIDMGDTGEKVQKFLIDNKCLAENSSVTDTLNTITRNMMQNEDVHSHGIDRVEKVFLAHPQIKKAIGCDSSAGGKYCE